jgi:predicted amidophosphoribosyltransferase
MSAGPAWVRCEKMMYFPRLDNQEHGHGAFTIAFRFTDDGKEPWTSRINRFKARDEQAICAAIDVLSEAVTSLDLSDEKIGVVSALGHDDKILQPKSPLARLGEAVASRLGAEWLPDLISKQSHPPLHNIKSAEDRHKTVKAAKYASKRNPNVGALLVIDDIVTNGSTASHIAEAILRRAPETRIFSVALGKSERRAYWRSRSAEIDNSHVQEEWARLWDKKR